MWTVVDDRMSPRYAIGTFATEREALAAFAHLDVCFATHRFANGARGSIMLLANLPPRAPRAQTAPTNEDA